MVANRNRGILITPLPGATKLKPSATRPFFGIHPVILSEEGKEIEGEATGALAIKNHGLVRCEQFIMTIKDLLILIFQPSKGIISQEMAQGETAMAIFGSQEGWMM